MQETPVMVPKMLRVEEVAERLDVGEASVWKLIYGGKLRVVRIGRLVRIAPEDLNDFIRKSA